MSGPRHVWAEQWSLQGSWDETLTLYCHRCHASLWLHELLPDEDNLAAILRFAETHRCTIKAES